MKNIRQVYLIYAAEQEGEHWQEFYYRHEIAGDSGACAKSLFSGVIWALDRGQKMKGNYYERDYLCLVDVQNALPGIELNDIWIY